jgi:biopolymer transport protein TolR
VLIVPDGFSLKARGGNVAPGCADTGPGIAIPRKDNDYDYISLKACAAKLKGAASEFKDEMGVTISANPPIPYQVVISTMDAVRNNEGGEPLFPEVSFGIAR